MDFNRGKRIIEICERLHAKNMLASADGNVSCLTENGTILITPAGLPKAFLRPTDLCIIDLDGRVISGKPSSERLMHLEVYRKCPAARWVVHAHPPTAIAWSIARPDLKELPAECISEIILAVGSIPIVPYGRPGTEEMAARLAPFLPAHRVMILAHHGALSWGEDYVEAYNGMERLEHAAQVLKAAHELGGLNTLPPKEIEELKKIRKSLGDRTL